MDNCGYAVMRRTSRLRAATSLSPSPGRHCGKSAPCVRSCLRNRGIDLWLRRIGRVAYAVAVSRRPWVCGADTVIAATSSALTEDSPTAPSSNAEPASALPAPSPC